MSNMTYVDIDEWKRVKAADNPSFDLPDSDWWTSAFFYLNFLTYFFFCDMVANLRFGGKDAETIRWKCVEGAYYEM